MASIELTHIFRQSDEHFIRILNRVRENRLDAATIKALNQRYIPDYIPGEGEGFITLTTHNHSADAINRKRLAALPEKPTGLTRKFPAIFPSMPIRRPADSASKWGPGHVFKE